MKWGVSEISCLQCWVRSEFIKDRFEHIEWDQMMVLTCIVQDCITITVQLIDVNVGLIDEISKDVDIGARLEQFECVVSR